MLRFNFKRKSLSVLLAVLILAIPAITQTTQQAGSYAEGKIDGEREAKGSAAWIAGGFLCGCFATLYVYAFAKPDPPSHALIGKSSEYIMGYTEGYQKKTNSKNGVYTLIGWGVSAAISTAILVAANASTY